MKLEEIEDNWGMSIHLYDDIKLVPKLFAVIKAAKEMRNYPQIADNDLACIYRFDDALNDLEKE